ncbi:MAG: peptidoglycan DD-metalloendopeptidase family protein [Bacteroidota bacterium]
MAVKEQLLTLLKKIFPTTKKLIVRLLLIIILCIAIWIAAHINWVLIFNGYPEPVIVETPVQQFDEFEFPVDSFSKEILIIHADEYLSEILQPRGVSLQIIDKIAREFKYVFDVKDIRQGNELHFYYTPDAQRRLLYMVYKKNDIDYVIYDFRDSVSVSLKQKEVIKEVRFLEGEIKSTLWEAVAEKGVDDGMVFSIIEVFQWMIDQYSLQRGDKFEVIYEDKLVDGKSIGSGKVFAARFQYSKKWFEAYEFIQNGKLGYFNEKGESLKREFLKAPLKEDYRISSRYSNSRMHPILRYRRPHHGVDYAAPTGTQVISIGDGKVIQRSYDKGSGNMVKIKHKGNFVSGYMHLSKFATGLSVGDPVSQGQVIGYVGSTGLSTGAHLDFRIWKGSQPVDPLKIEAPPVEPLESRNKPAFDSIVKNYRAEFEKYRLEVKSLSDNP